MLVLLHQWSLGRDLLSGRLKCADLPELARGHGFDGIEWLDRLLPSYDPAQWRELGRAQEEAGLQAAALSLCLEVVSSPPRLAEQVDRAKRILGMGSLLGLKAVRVSLGAGQGISLSGWLHRLEGLRGRQAREAAPLGPLSRLAYRLAAAGPLNLVAERRQGNEPSRADSGLLQRAAWALTPLARQAADLGLALGVENHPGLTAHPEDLLALLELCGRPAPGVCLDLGNTWRPEASLDLCRRLAPHAVHVHLKAYADMERQSALRNYPECLAELAKSGYSGLLVVENNDPRLGIDPAVQAADLARRLWGEAA